MPQLWRRTFVMQVRLGCQGHDACLILSLDATHYTLPLLTVAIDRSSLSKFLSVGNIHSFKLDSDFGDGGVSGFNIAMHPGRVLNVVEDNEIERLVSYLPETKREGNFLYIYLSYYIFVLSRVDCINSKAQSMADLRYTLYAHLVLPEVHYAPD